MAKYTVIYGTNVLIPKDRDKEKGELKPVTFFTDIEAISKEKAEWQVEQQIETKKFIKDNGGYLRRTSTIVSYIVKTYEEPMVIKTKYSGGK